MRTKPSLCWEISFFFAPSMTNHLTIIAVVTFLSIISHTYFKFSFFIVYDSHFEFKYFTLIIALLTKLYYVKCRFFLFETIFIRYRIGTSSLNKGGTDTIDLVIYSCNNYSEQNQEKIKLFFISIIISQILITFFAAATMFNRIIQIILGWLLCKVFSFNHFFYFLLYWSTCNIQHNGRTVYLLKNWIAFVIW